MPHGVDFQELPIFDLLERQPQSRHVRLKTYVYSRNGVGPVHRHLYYGIELVTGGHCTQYINGAAHSCAPGSVCLLSPFDYHSFQFTGGAVNTCCLSFTEDVLTKEVLDGLNNARGPCFLQLPERELEAFTQMLAQLERELDAPGVMHRTLVEAAVNSMVVYLLRNAQSEVPTAAKGKSDIRFSIAYIRRHFRENLTLEEIAGAFGVTPNHFCKYFKKITGITFKAYLLQLRLEYAMKQLVQTQQSVTEICLDSGFNSPSYFTKAFKARFGKAPTAYRAG